MVKGIGVDTVSVNRIRAVMERHDKTALKRLFTEAELAASENKNDPAEYLAARFAVKEAVYKAVAGLTQKGDFDMRLVSSLNERDGRPYVVITDDLKRVLDEAGVSVLHLSITTEASLATAFVVAEG